MHMYVLSEAKNVVTILSFRLCVPEVLPTAANRRAQIEACVRRKLSAILYLALVVICKIKHFLRSLQRRMLSHSNFNTTFTPITYLYDKDFEESLSRRETLKLLKGIEV